MDNDDFLTPSAEHPCCFSQFCVWFKVDGDQQPLDVTGHFPILAGFDAFGKEIYVAQAGFLWTYVSDGARNVSIADRDGKVKLFSQFELLVLRHDPLDIVFNDIPAGAKYQTGPVYWLHDERPNEDIWDATDFLWDTESEPDRESLPGGRIEEIVGIEGCDPVPSRDSQEDRFEGGADCDSEVITESIDNDAERFEMATLGVETNTKQGSGSNDILDYAEGLKKGFKGGDPLAGSHRAHRLIEEERRNLKTEKQALADRMKRIEERERELELEELRITQSGRSS